MSWHTDLTRPIKPVDHPALKTLSDVCAYMSALPARVAKIETWQYAGELLVAAAEGNDPAAIRAATDQVERALFATYRLDEQEPPVCKRSDPQ